MVEDVLARIGEIATVGGTTLVAAMVTDCWETVRDRFASLLGGGDRHREVMQRELLNESRDRVLADPAREATVIAEWQASLRQALVREPSLALPLVSLLDDVSGQLTAPTPGAVAQRARADRGGVVVQAGRDAVHVPPGTRR